MSSRFYIVDVFSSRPFRGNPVAVVLACPDEEDMRAVASWTGMPETVFVTEPTLPGADYAVRIFSPSRELAFAGHPSLGTCHALLELGLVKAREGVVRQQCPAGLFDLRVDARGGHRTISFTASTDSIELLPTQISADVERALGAKPVQVHLVKAGAEWIIARFSDGERLAALNPDMGRLRRLSEHLHVYGISVFGPSPDEDADVELRSFAPALGVDEDAACGSGSACVAAVVAQDSATSHHVGAITASQGRHLGRHARLRLLASRLDKSVVVAGEAVTTLSGTIMLPWRDAPMPSGSRNAASARGSA